MSLVNFPLDTNAWRGQAACHGEMGAAFYPPLGSEKRAAREAREARAKAVCADCTVSEHCLEQALDRGERYGIWGGLTDGERRRLAS